MVGAQGQISQRQLMQQLVVDARTAREHAAQIIERECESPPLNTPVPAPPQPIFSRRGAAVGACQKLPPVLRMGFNSDASDHPQLYQVHFTTFTFHYFYISLHLPSTFHYIYLLHFTH